MELDLQNEFEKKSNESQIVNDKMNYEDSEYNQIKSMGSITVNSSRRDTNQMKYLKDDIDSINQQFNALGMKMIDKFDMYETENETSTDSPMIA